MIGKLTGVIDSLNEDGLLLDVNGVGYVVHASSKTIGRLGASGSNASILIETQVREDAITLYGFASYAGIAVSIVVLAALLVTLIPTTIGGLLSAIGIAGMDRLVKFNVLATSGRAVEAAGDVDVLLLDKTGTITLGDRQATAFIPVPGVAERELAESALLASAADDTAEGRSIVALATDCSIEIERSRSDEGSEAKQDAAAAAVPD